MIITVIGRGHSGTRAISQTLMASGVFMGRHLNSSGDLLPPDSLYRACKVMAPHVRYLGDVNWDFSSLCDAPPDIRFIQLVMSYLKPVLKSTASHKGWKLPETTLIYPWIVRMFPEVYYIHLVRDPRDCILGSHLTDELRLFGIPCAMTDDIWKRRVVSWTYQRKIVKATPSPKHSILVRFEDFVLHQVETLKRLEEFLGHSLARIPVNPDAVGRWRSHAQSPEVEICKDEMEELGYGS